MLRDEQFYLNSYSEPFQRLIWEPMLRHTSALYPIARRDPIFTPIFTAIGFTGTITIGTATISTAAIASAIATTALTVGIQMLMAPKPPKPEDGKVPLTQAVPYRQWGVGRCRIAGAYMLWEAKGRNLYVVQAIAGHKIKSVNRYFLHDDEVTLDANGVTQGASGERYENNVTIHHRLGDTPETPYSLLVDKLSAEGIWTNQHRGDGQASLMMIAQSVDGQNQSSRFPYGPPRLSVEADLAYVFDYRISSDPSNPAAWVWSRNSALIMAWHQCFNEFGHRRDFNRAILPVLDMWIEEANVCDEDVPRAGGGFEKRYECNGFDTTENGPKAATNAILASCDGWICERGDGALLFTVGKFRESRVGVLTDRDIIGHNVQYDVLPEEECNRLIPKFTYPETNYTTCDTDFFEDAAEQITAGRVLAQEAEYMWVHQWRQARRLGIREWRRIQQKTRGSLDVRLSGLNAVYSRWVRLETPRRLPGLNGQIIENRRSLLALLRGGLSMEFIRHPANIDDWNPATDEGQQPPVPAAPNAEGILTPVINLVQARPQSGSVYIRVVIIDPEDDSLYPVVRYRLADAGGGIPGAWVEQRFPNAAPSGGFINMSTNVVPNDEILEVQVAFITSGGDYGDWSITATVTSTSDPTPAGLVTDVSVSPAAGTATFNWTAPNSNNYAGANIYYSTVNDVGTASFAGPTEYGSPNASDSAMRAFAPGSYYGWIRSVNRSGIEGTAIATGSFTVT